MEINGSLTISVRPESVEISFRDEDARVVILDVGMKPIDFLKALQGSYRVPIKAEVFNLDKVGKLRESKTFEFVVDNPYDYLSRNEEALYEEAQRKAPEGWRCDKYFGSRNSFFQIDGENWCRVTIRRWIDKE